MSRSRALRWGAVLLGGSAIVLSGCGRESPGGPPAGPPPVEVTVTTVQPRTVALPYEFTGRLEASREVEVRARVSGILLERTYDEGRPVRKGQTLFVIDPAPYRAEVRAAEAELAEERARLARAEREIARLAPLVAERAVSRKDYDDQASDAEEAQAAILSAEARLDLVRLDLSYTRIEAPISGLSSRSLRSEGSLIEPGVDSLLTRLVQVQPIWVRFSLPDRTRLALQQAMTAKRVSAPPTDRLEIELLLPDDSIHAERGKVNFSDALIDDSTGSVDLRAELPNAAGDLVPGQFVRVRLLGIERLEAILVPQRAVQQGQGGKFVLLVDAQGQAEVRPVVVGDWLGPDWIIESGLAAGDRVIVDGASKALPGAPVSVAE